MCPPVIIQFCCRKFHVKNISAGFTINGGAFVGC